MLLAVQMTGGAGRRAGRAIDCMTTLGEAVGRPKKRRQYSLAVGLVLLCAGIVAWALSWNADRMRMASVWDRADQILRQHHTSVATARVQDLFGAGVDGVCVFANSIPQTDSKLIGRTPPELRPALLELVRRNPNHGWGPNRWFVFVVRSGKLTESYEWFFHSNVEVLDSDLNAEGCYKGTAPVVISMAEVEGQRFLGFRFHGHSP